jgi:hypothetical protein
VELPLWHLRRGSCHSAEDTGSVRRDTNLVLWIWHSSYSVCEST